MRMFALILAALLLLAASAGYVMFWAALIATAFAFWGVQLPLWLFLTFGFVSVIGQMAGRAVR